MSERSAVAQILQYTELELLQRLARKDAHIVRSPHQAAESWAIQEIIYEAEGVTDYVAISRFHDHTASTLLRVSITRQEDAFTLMIATVAKPREHQYDIPL